MSRKVKKKPISFKNWEQRSLCYENGHCCQGQWVNDTVNKSTDAMMSSPTQPFSVQRPMAPVIYCSSHALNSYLAPLHFTSELFWWERKREKNKTVKRMTVTQTKNSDRISNRQATNKTVLYPPSHFLTAHLFFFFPHVWSVLYILRLTMYH